MDRWSDTIRSMFDLIGIMPSQAPAKTKTQVPIKTQAPIKTQTASKSKCQTKTSRKSSVGSKKSKSQISTGKTSRESLQSGHRTERQVRTKPQETVFASKLLPSTSLTGDVTSSRWISVNSMAANRYHCAVYFIHCAQHKRVAVTKPSNQQALWMPFTAIPNNRSYEDSGLAGLLIILSGANMDLFLSLKEHLPYTEKHLMELRDIQLAQTQSIITRLTWYVRLDQSKMDKPHAHFKCCQDTDLLVWIEEKDIIEQSAVLDYLWGSELHSHYQAMIDAYNNGIIPNCNGYEEYNLEMAFEFMPRHPHTNDEQHLLYTANLSENDIERLYLDFLDHCFPCTNMTMHSFKVYMTKYGMKYADEQLEPYFRAFNYKCNGSITFPELLIGLACIDRNSAHNGTRSKFIARYYDVNKCGYLSEHELRIMLQDMHQGITAEEIDQKLAQVLAGLETEPDPNKPGKVRTLHRKFNEAIGNHTIRGTSKLCRLNRPILMAITSAIFSRMKHQNVKKDHQYANVLEKPYVGICLGCKAKRPTLDEHLYKLSADGYVVDCTKPQQLQPLTSGSSASVQPQDRKRQASKVTKKQGSKSSKSVEKVSSSVEDIQPTESVVSIGGAIIDNEEAVKVAIKVIQLVRNFEPNKGTTSRPNGLLTESNQDRKSFVEMFEVLDRALYPVLKQTRCVQVASPAYIIGDIHGNLSDLLSLERAFWKRVPVIGPNLVFLGDMVDRGKWSIECVAYLLALKVLMPNKVTLLRGNHEVRSLQCRYSYRVECLQKYGNEYGSHLWELTNKIFDHLPLCAVIDEAIYCAHGGIPRATIDLRDVATLPEQISDPEHESQVAWEILWSDPMAQHNFVEAARIMQVDLAHCQGYVPNQKRGTAWAFNEEATDRFLATNGLTHLVRAHEVPTQGFFFNFDRKCTTIFSCSHYCGNNNESAVLLVDRDIIRVVRVDTSNNASATD